MTIKGGRKRNRTIHQISFGNPFSFETLITSSSIRFPNFSSLNLGLTYILFISPQFPLVFLKLIVTVIFPSTLTNNNLPSCSAYLSKFFIIKSTSCSTSRLKNHGSLFNSFARNDKNSFSIIFIFSNCDSLY